jgi:EAL domain-containing protein (putative c-di-GMP-specific phosphodiesterase class I)
MRISAIKQRQPDIGETAQAALSSVTFKDSKVAACFRGLALTSHLQPIFSLAHQRAVGYEGLLRCANRKLAPLSPLEIFARCRNESDAVAMDRLCRTLHLRNFAARNVGDAWLCINVNPRAIRKSETHDPFFGQLLDQLGFPAGRIVVVIPKSTGPDEEHLKSWVDHYRGLGCLIALNDFAAGRIWRLRPDFVMLDRSFIAEAGANPAARAMLPRIVSMIHETRAMVILQGIESGREAVIAMDCDAEFVQGHYFAHPAPTGEPHEFSDRIEAVLATAYRAHADAVARAQAEMMARVRAEQQEMARLLAPAVADGHVQLPAAVDREEPRYHPAARRVSIPGRLHLSRLMGYFRRTTPIAPATMAISPSARSGT